MKGFITLILVLSCSISSAAKDEAGSKDHSLLSRFNDFYITEYQHSEYDEAEIMSSVFDNDKRHADILKLEGKVTNIQYINPRKDTITSTLDVFNHYERLLTEANAEFILNCRNKKCFVDEAGEIGVSITIWANKRKQLMKGFLANIDSDFGLLTGKITGEDNETTHVFLAISATKDNKYHYVSMSIIEPAMLDTDKIRVVSKDKK